MKTAVAPNVTIWTNIKIQGIPSCILTTPPFNAETMFNLEVHNAEPQRVIIAIKKPHAQPANTDDQSQAKVNKSEPAAANILSNATLIIHAKPSPRNAPITPAKDATITPS